MGDYTPSTDEVRLSTNVGTGGMRVSRAEFDRWLAARDAEREKAVRERIAQDIKEATEREEAATLGGNSAPTAGQRARAGGIGWGGILAARIAREGVAP